MHEVESFVIDGFAGGEAVIHVVGMAGSSFFVREAVELGVEVLEVGKQSLQDRDSIF